MADEIKAGDIVQLKSGGPVMTVTWVADEYGVMTASCTWFDGKKKSDATFPVTSLKHVEA
jgi:uncharacterized protein YodC (DUF2158 family)